MRNNDAMRDQERVRMDATGEEKRVCMAYNSIIISSDDESDSHRKIMNYSLKMFFNALSMWRVMNCIFLFLV